MARAKSIGLWAALVLFLLVAVLAAVPAARKPLYKAWVKWTNTTPPRVPEFSFQTLFVGSDVARETAEHAHEGLKYLIPKQPERSLSAALALTRNPPEASFCEGPYGDGGPLGIENSWVAFVAAHGSPEGFDFLSGKCAKEGLRFGNLHLRYLLACSCNLLAHGPAECGPYGGSKTDYLKPHCFACEGSSSCPDCPSKSGAGTALTPDSCEMRNALHRWKDILAPEIRMLCAGSSKICDGSGDAANGVWQALKGGKTTIVDAYLSNLTNSPACLTRGGPKVGQSPFQDKDFTEETNRWASASERYFHFAYRVSDPGTEKQAQEAANMRRILAQLKGPLPAFRLGKVSSDIEKARWILDELGKKDWSAEVEADTGGIILRNPEGPEPKEFAEVAPDFVHQGIHSVLRNRHRRSARPEAGASAARKTPYGQVVPPAPPAPGYLSDGTYSALKRLDIKGTPVDAFRLLLDITQDKRGESAPTTQYVLKGAAKIEESLDLSQWDSRLHHVRVIGDGGNLRLDVAPDQSLAAVTLVSRQIEAVMSTCEICGPEEARAFAEKKFSEELGDSEINYYGEDKDAFEFGYKEYGLGVRQVRLEPVYRFRFVPMYGAYSYDDFPPRTIEMTACKPGCLTAEPPQPNPQ